MSASAHISAGRVAKLVDQQRKFVHTIRKVVIGHCET